MDSKRKPLIIGISIFAVILLVSGLGLLWFNSNQQPEPTPAPTKSSSDTTGLGEAKDEIRNSELLAEFVGTDDFMEKSLATDGAFNTETSEANELSLGMLRPFAVATSLYIKDAYFNPYFVSGYWEQKDNFSENALNKFLKDKVTEKELEELKTLSKGENPRELLKDKIYMPTNGIAANEDCAEKWTGCFVADPQITSISVNGTSETTAKVDAVFTVETLHQIPDADEGELNVEVRTYKVSFDVVNTNTDYETLKLTDIKVDKTTGSLEISYND